MRLNRKLFYGIIIIFFVIMVSSILAMHNKLTYIEYTTINESDDGGYLQLNTDGDSIVQEFTMPYDIMHGFSVKIGTFARDNNSEWDVIVEETDTGKIIYQTHFNASLIVDNEFYTIEFDKNVRLKRGEAYKIHIIADSVKQNTGLAFYRSNDSKADTSTLIFNKQKVSGSLCFRIYGGDVDIWWMGFAIAVYIFIGSIIIRVYILQKKGKKILEDTVFQSMLVGTVIFLLLCTFAISEQFTDELDNMRGGMIIARGGVLYRDYVTQHTPVAYYLCSIFALLGAGSIAQFRLSYYIFEAIIWGGLYTRHVAYFGKKKMAVLPILEVVFISSIITPQGSQILSDGLQGICMVALLLEFIRYYGDKKLGWDRCLIISASIWGSFGAAFVSAYALVWVVLIVSILEVKEWILKGFKISSALNRYWKILTALLVPLFCAIIYFKLNHSLKIAFEQFYSFNREVYSKYNGGMGEKLSQPFINAIQNFFNIISNNFNKIITATATNITILQFIIVILATIVVLILASKKRIIEAFLLFMVMCCSATRGYEFHGLAAWYIAIMLIAIFYDELLKYMPKVGLPLAGLLLVFGLSTYVEMVGNNLLYNQTSISEIESNIVSMTDDGEGILIDAYCCDSLYFLYKNRYPVNRAVYMLPWYMDWYEQDTIDDLENTQPRVVIYYENQDTWGYTQYANAFASELKANYTKLSDNPDDGWRCTVWVRNN